MENEKPPTLEELADYMRLKPIQGGRIYTWATTLKPGNLSQRKVKVMESGISQELYNRALASAPDQVTLAEIWDDGIDGSVKPELEDRFKGIPKDFVIFRRAYNNDSFGIAYTAPIWNPSEAIEETMKGVLIRDGTPRSVVDRDFNFKAVMRRHYRWAPEGYVWLVRVINGTVEDNGTHKIYWVRIQPLHSHAKVVSAIAQVHGLHVGGYSSMNLVIEQRT